MKINFYPESDNPRFEKAAKEYAEIWEKEGDKFIAVIEKISGLKFKEKIINALIHENNSYSAPLHLMADMSIKNKKRSLIHELCHRLTYGNNIKLEVGYSDKNWNLEVHKLIDLILYDIYVALYGKEFTKKSVEHEINLWNGKAISPYKIAWDWVLSMTKEERQKEFKKYLAK